MPVLSHGLETRKVPLTSFHEVADYIKKYNRLPDNFITKKDAGTLGWNPSKGNLWAVAPGKSIGGDVFRNREKKLPVKRGRIWYEADIDYQGGKRGKDRILFSSDGLIYKTEDHYRTFTRMH
ncbi:MAG: ribonuclease [Deltaproteobacteria bacterium]|nr:ribonuclease [Deltaproteobacteria bacterium]